MKLAGALSRERPVLRVYKSGVPNTTYGIGRRCPDCNSVVSRYNPNDYCAQCADKEPGRRKTPPRRALFDDPRKNRKR